MDTLQISIIITGVFSTCLLIYNSMPVGGFIMGLITYYAILINDILKSV